MSQAAVAATIRVGNVGAIPTVFQTLGLDLGSALRSVGLSVATFDDPEAVVPYIAVGELFRLAVHKSGCDHFGLLVGMAQPDMGLPGFLMQHAPTARAGLEIFVASVNRVDSGGVVGLKEEDGVATLSYSVTAVGVPSVDHICDAALAIGFGILKRVIQDFAPIEIRLPRRRPSNLAPYRAFFSKGQLTFDTHDAAIDFPLAFLNEPIRRADPALYRFLLHILAKAGSAAEPSMAEQIKRILPNLIRQTQVTNGTIAQMFGVHPRTIARRLAEENVTLHDLVQDARFQVAQQLLCTTNLSLTQIAAGLHYSDASAFTRAFRRKFRLTPSAWRRGNRATTAEQVQAEQRANF